MAKDHANLQNLPKDNEIVSYKRSSVCFLFHFKSAGNNIETATYPTLLSIAVVAKPSIRKSQNDILPCNFSSKFSCLCIVTLIQWPLNASSMGAHALFRALSGPAGHVNLGCFSCDQTFYCQSCDVNETEIWIFSLLQRSSLVL